MKESNALNELNKLDLFLSFVTAFIILCFPLIVIGTFGFSCAFILARAESGSLLANWLVSHAWAGDLAGDLVKSGGWVGTQISSFIRDIVIVITIVTTAPMIITIAITIAVTGAMILSCLATFIGILIWQAICFGTLTILPIVAIIIVFSFIRRSTRMDNQSQVLDSFSSTSTKTDNQPKKQISWEERLIINITQGLRDIFPKDWQHWEHWISDMMDSRARMQSKGMNHRLVSLITLYRLTRFAFHIGIDKVVIIATRRATR
jgi:hypothetical protein